MKLLNQVEEDSTGAELVADSDPLRPLVVGRATTATEPFSSSGGVIVGTLLGMTDDARTPLVIYPGQAGSAAIAARSAVDVQAEHIGRQVVLVFEGADSAKPIVMGILRNLEGSALEQRHQNVEVESDGERMIVNARAELVLRCGRASITLTKAGKVLIHGTYVSSRSTGVNRIKGGSVQLN
jgi:hypothetical protein